MKNDAYLTFEQASAVFSYDPTTGIILWKVRQQGHSVAGIAGTPDKGGYRVIRHNRRRHFAHRLAWLLYFRSWPESMLDHINGDTSDNRIENLRPATSLQNGGNHRLHKHNTSGFRGIRQRKSDGFWIVRVGKGPGNHVGRFKTLEAAQAAHRAAFVKRYGEFAQTRAPAPEKAPDTCPHCIDETDCSNVAACNAVAEVYAKPAPEKG